jgi:hypothetical protein
LKKKLKLCQKLLSQSLVSSWNDCFGYQLELIGLSLGNIGLLAIGPNGMAVGLLLLAQIWTKALIEEDN